MTRGTDNALWFPRTASTLGAVYMLAGRPPEARALLEEALERTIAMELIHQRALIMVWLGEAALAVGRLTDAEQMAEQALQLSRDNDERGHEAWALRLLGEIASRSAPDGAAAADYYGQVQARAKALGMRPVVAHALLGLGTHGAAGVPDHRCADLKTAAAMFREMGMGFWLAKAASALEKAPASGATDSRRRGVSGRARSMN